MKSFNLMDGVRLYESQSVCDLALEELAYTGHHVWICKGQTRAPEKRW